MVLTRNFSQMLPQKKEKHYRLFCFILPDSKLAITSCKVEYEI
jgi:hypothetical protein